MAFEPFALERYFARHEFTSRYLLCASDCESLTIAELLALEPGGGEGFLAQWLGYTDSSGAPALRSEIARLYSVLDADEVLVHTGAEEAMFLFFQSLLSAGDHIIVQTPCYQSALSVPRGAGCDITEWACRYERRWEPDLDELERAFRPNTRALYINSPHNPTGFHFDRRAFEHIIALADAREVVVFSDEVYRELEYEPDLLLPPACDLSERAVSLGVMSKTYGLPGLRIGWIATRNHEVLHATAAAKDYTTICNSAPSEYLAALALRHRSQLVERNLSIVRRNLPLLDAFFTRYGHVLQWVRPTAGSVAFPRLMLPIGSTEFCDGVLARSGVLLAPGETFSHPGHVRIGIGRSNMQEALGRLEDCLAETWPQPQN
jgi:aspartate/methionine/tyrosine aminotransferase